MSDKKLTATIYTDGGCKPNPGFGGSGFHAQFSNGQWFDGWWSGPATATNNTAEVDAAAYAINFAIDHQVKELKLRPDSQYTINGATKWHYNWVKNNWVKSDGLPVPNRENWEKLIAAMDAAKANDIKIKWQWVEGHSGVAENERADRAATRGRIASSKGQEVSELREYTEKTYGRRKPPKYNRLLSMDKWYFFKGEPEKTQSGYYAYCCGYHGRPDAKERLDKIDTALGKELPESYHCVVYLKEPEEILEHVRKEHYRLLDTSQGLVNVGTLSKINTSAAYQELLDHGGLYLHLDDKTQSRLQTIDKVPLSHIANPPKLSLSIQELYDALFLKMEDYLAGQYPADSITDITDHFYETEVNKKGKEKTVLKKEIDSSLKALKVAVKRPGGESEITLTIGLDTPIRNTLSALKDDDPHVFVLTWLEGDYGFRYATLVSTNDGLILWVASYSNLMFIRDKK